MTTVTLVKTLTGVRRADLRTLGLEGDFCPFGEHFIPADRNCRAEMLALDPPPPNPER